MDEFIRPGHVVSVTLSHDSVGRIIAGLGWHPNPDTGIKGKLQRMMGNYADSDFDLDISCYIYDDEKNCLDSVTGEKGHLIDASGCVRHHGDERDGQTDGDDEVIEIDLLALPPEITRLVVTCETASAHSFGNIHNPLAHIADYGTSDDFIRVSLGKNTGADCSACVLALLHRDTDDNWQLKHLGDYMDREAIDDWTDYLKSYL